MTTADMLRARLQDKPGVVGASCILHSGRYFDFIDPKPDQFDDSDIAWGLSLTCRFGGHCNEFYSVAQHSLIVASMAATVRRDLILPALLHDAAEAFVGDMIGPLKQLCPDFRAIEKRVEAVIFAKYGIAAPLDPTIKHADLRALRTEQRDLTSAAGVNWNGLDQYAPHMNTISPLAPRVAFAQYLSALRMAKPQ